MALHLSRGVGSDRGDEPSLARRALAVVVLLGAVIVGLAARRFTRVTVDGPSMEPTLRRGDRLLVRRTTRVRPGELVVVRDPRATERLWVKRATDVTDEGVVVHGDAPHRSTDSRQVGPIPRRLVVGRVVRRYATGG